MLNSAICDVGSARLLQLTIRLNRLIKRLLLVAAWVLRTASFVLGRVWAENGRNKNIIVVDWENGTRAACNNRAGNVH